MSEMEKDARQLLSRTLRTISLVVLWLLVNSTLGIMMGWFFFYRVPQTGNYIFYAWFLLSGFFLFRYIFRLWNKPLTTD